MMLHPEWQQLSAVSRVLFLNFEGFFCGHFCFPGVQFASCPSLSFLSFSEYFFSVLPHPLFTCSLLPLFHLSPVPSSAPVHLVSLSSLTCSLALWFHTLSGFAPYSPSFVLFSSHFCCLANLFGVLLRLMIKSSGCDLSSLCWSGF